jgi:hypothetical protein
MSSSNVENVQTAELEGSRIEYLYRDAGNWKVWGEFELLGKVTLDEINELLLDEFWFIPPAVGIESLTPEQRNDDDHPFHEIHAVEPITVTSSTLSVEDFLDRMEGAQKTGWLELCKFYSALTVQNKL